MDNFLRYFYQDIGRVFRAFLDIFSSFFNFLNYLFFRIFCGSIIF